MAKKKLVVIQPNVHRVYWGWYRILNEYFDFYLIVPKEGYYINIPFIDQNKIIPLKNIANVFKPYNIKLKGLVSILKKINPDIIMSKIIYLPYTVEAFKYATKNNKKFFVIDELKHHPPNPIHNVIFRLYFRYIEKVLKDVPIIAVTKQSFEFFTNHRFNEVYYVPCSFWKNDYKPKRHPQDKVRLLYVGYLYEVKNVEFVLYTLRYIFDNKLLTYDEIEFTIVGDGTKRKNIENTIKKLNLSKSVNMLGKVENKKLDKIYKSHNLFILPSIREAVGLVVLEAMYNSLPVLCSIKAGASSYIVPYYNGLIFNPKSIKNLANCIFYYKDANKREEHGNNSLEILKNSYDYNKIGKELIKIIGELDE